MGQNHSEKENREREVDGKLLQVGGEAKRRPKLCCTAEPRTCALHVVSDPVKM